MSGELNKCHLKGAMFKKGRCYLGEGLVVESKDDFKQTIDQYNKAGKNVVTLFTANWCPGCNVIKPHVIAGSEYMPTDTEFLVCDSSEAGRDSCGMLGAAFIPSFRVYESNGETTDVNVNKFFNYYSAGHQVGLKLLKPCNSDATAWEVGPSFNIHTPLLKYGIQLQVNANVETKDGGFDSVSAEVKMYTPSIGDFIRWSPLRFGSIFVGTGVKMDSDIQFGMKNSIGVELVRGQLYGWALGVEVTLYEFDPVQGVYDGYLPKVGFIVGHSF